MELKELKCKNCGANLKVEQNAKDVTCNFCHTTFSVESAENTGYEFEKGRIKAQKEELQNTMKSASNSFNKTVSNIDGNEIGKAVGKSFTTVAIVIVAMFIMVIAIGIIGFSFISGMNDNNDFVQNEETEVEEPLLSDVSKLTDSELSTIENKGKGVASISSSGRSDTKYSYQTSDSLRLEKIYIAYKKDSNQVIVAYKQSFHNFFNQSDVHTVYSLAIYKNVKSSLNLENGKNPAPEYYFNPDKSSYTYAFANMEELYNTVIKPLEDDGYKITST